MANRRSNGGNGSPESVSSLVEIMQAPAANTFLVSQRFALEAAKFWARRMRAYADQMEDLASCRSPDDIAGAHSGKTNCVAIACAGLSFAPVHSDFVQIAP